MLGPLLRAYPEIEAIIGDRLGEAASLLERYMGEIELFNSAYGLVSVRNRRELAVRHILDSLAPLAILDRVLSESQAPQTGGPRRAADVGSGAGLPGIPLAIALPSCSFTLIERMGRRAGFLRNTLAVLGIKNAVIEEREMEKAQIGPCRLVTLRAFHPLSPVILKGLFRLLEPGGVIAAYKGKKEKTLEEIERAGLKDGWELVPCPVPSLDEERNILLIRKQVEPYNEL